MSKKTLKFYLILPWLVLLLGSIISILVWYYFDRGLLKQSEEAFNSRAQEIADSINYRIQRDAYLLNSLQGLFVASDLVERGEFFDFIKALDLTNNYPGIFALYYFSLVSEEGLDDFAETIRQDTSLNPEGYPDFSLWPKNENSEHLILNYFYPESTETALGFDFFSDTKRQSVANQSFSDNQIYATKRINTIPDNVIGFNIVAPIYKNGLTKTKENAAGLLVASIKLDQFFTTIFNEKQKEFWQDFDLEVFDVSPEELVFDSEYVFDYDAHNFVEAPNNLSAVFPISLSGSSWSLKVIGNHDYGFGTYDHFLPLFLSLGSLLITLLLFVSLKLLVSSRQRAINQAMIMTRDLKENQEQLEIIFNNSADAIFVHSPSGSFLMVNKTACERLGFSQEEMLKKSPQDIDAPEFSSRVSERIKEISKFGRAIFESAHLTKDGRRIPVEISSRLINFRGKPAILSVVRDITKRKEIEEALQRRTDEAERLNKTMVGRELKMIELKEEFRRLKK